MLPFSTAELLHQRGSVRHGGQKRGPISNGGSLESLRETLGQLSADCRCCTATRNENQTCTNVPDAKLKVQRCSRGQYEPGTRRWRLDVTYRRVVSATCRRTASQHVDGTLMSERGTARRPRRQNIACNDVSRVKHSQTVSLQRIVASALQVLHCSTK